MNMKLTLAVALECGPTDCRVQLVEDGSIITVAYSAPVHSRGLKIHPHQLVVLDTNPTTPEIVYRWHYNKVEELKGDKVIIKDHQGQLAELVKAEGVEVSPQVGDWVFVALGSGLEVLDIAIEGRPAHPAYFREYAFPKVEQFYQKITSGS